MWKKPSKPGPKRRNEAGLFHTSANIPTVVCGPGDIAVAHKPNEYISLDQITKAEDFMRRLADEVCAG